ncbi:J domain-containing protein [Flexithrix dorotheae]|uniref:J domain-containing protein n=1 Tax=Flexithrix dorotheae TaxID=70993 RepID=UPI000382A333|nr:DnaJ domain-containing protein [Flexithrix dorotheae]
MLDRIKNLLRAELNDKFENFSGFKEKFEDLEIDEILKKFSKQEAKEQKHESKQEDYSYSNTDDYQYQSSQSYTNNSQNQLELEYYKRLEIPYGSPFVEIKKAYRKLMKIYHPDLYHNDQEKFKMAKEVSQKLNEAYVYFEKKHKK